jgi:hypothetical protein
MRVNFRALIALVWVIMSPPAEGRTERNTVSKPDFDVEVFKSCLPTAKNSDGVDACYERSVAFDHIPLVGGGHNEQVIRSIIAYHLPDIRKCAEIEKKAGRFTGHKILAKIEVNFQTGSVRDVTLTPSTSSNVPKQLIDCMTRKIREWSFPHRPLGERFVINYPFAFNAE